VTEEVDEVPDGSAAALHGLLNAPGAPPRDGDPLPPLWHWMAFLPRTAQEALGPDGHPKTGSFVDANEFPQRMFAGSRIAFPGTAKVGQLLKRRSRVTSVAEKVGRTGPLLFVTVEHIIEADDRVVIEEEQDLVYRPASRQLPTTVESSEGVDVGEQWKWKLDLATDATALFRFSALTYNSHRIHYDRPYATETEGYPGLVVQGPYQAIGLAELCRRNSPKAVLESFQFRAVRAAFDGVPLRLRGRLSDVVELAAYDEYNQQTMTASAILKT
jgi:3-methylfumaryl-CoA hydratase